MVSSGASSPHDIHFKLKHSDSTAAILEEEKQFAEFYSMAHDLPKIKNIILIDKIKLFSDEEDAPEWTIIPCCYPLYDKKSTQSIFPVRKS
jgi:hypothetical protein